MINSLTARIFAIFWFTLALVLMLVLMVPKLDSRQMTSLLDSEQRQGLMLEQHVEAELQNDPANDLMWWRRLFRAIDKWAPPGQRLLLVTSEGRVIGAQRNEMQIVRNFIGQSDNSDHPKKKKYGRVELVGPFAVRDGEDNYQLYLIRPANSPQSDFINLMFDRPLLLLIVTMLISAPLLLWLAWSLAKPARKLKNAADDVARGNLKQHPELEAGPQEFLATGASFNQMVSALERMMNAQQRLISDISHELRTPLTRLQLATALMRRRHGEGHELARIETEAQRLDSMINDLLALSRGQQRRAGARAAEGQRPVGRRAGQCSFRSGTDGQAVGDHRAARPLDAVRQRECAGQRVGKHRAQRPALFAHPHCRGVQRRQSGRDHPG